MQQSLKRDVPQAESHYDIERQLPTRALVAEDLELRSLVGWDAQGSIAPLGCLRPFKRRGLRCRHYES